MRLDIDTHMWHIHYIVHRVIQTSSIIPYSQNMAVIKFGSLVSNAVLAELYLVVWYTGVAICTYMWFNLVVERHTTKPPNLIPRQLSGYTIILLC